MNQRYITTLFFYLFFISLNFNFYINCNNCDACDTSCKYGHVQIKSNKYIKDGIYIDGKTIRYGNITPELYKEKEKILIENLDLTINEIKNIESIENIATTITQHEIGFKNIGNTCYLNALLQMLTHSYDFVYAIIKTSLDIKEDENKKSAPMIVALSIFFLKIYKIIKKIKPIDNVENAISDLVFFLINNNTKGEKESQRNNLLIPNQGDPHEFMECLSQDIEEESTVLGLKDDILSEFTIEVETTIGHCKKCNENKAPQKYKYHARQISIKENKKIEEMLSIEKEKLEEFKCYESKKNVNNAIKIDKYTYNENIFIIFKRYSYNKLTGDLSKIKTDIDIKDKITVNENTYYLKSVAIQKGGINSGHYVNYTRINDKWIYFDDSNSVRGLDINKVKKDIKQGYFILYEQKK